MFGQLHTQWADTQQRYLESLSKRSTGLRWTAAVIEKLWDICWDLWSTRNDFEHKEDELRRREQTAEAIQNALSTNQSILTGTQFSYLRDPAEVARMLQSNQTYQRRWLESVTAAQDMILRQSNRVLQRMRANLHTFLRG
jgi:hypothetical protein